MASVKAIERNIGRIEGFDVRFRHLDGRDVRSDKTQIPAYPYDFAEEDWGTVAAWKEHRFKWAYPGFKVEILDASGIGCDGEMLLSDVRATYPKK